MFRAHHRKVRIFFGISDLVLVAAAFQIAYWTRVVLSAKAFAFEHTFYLLPPVLILLTVFSTLLWIGLGAWWEIYDRIDAAHSRVIIRDAFRQCVLGATGVVLLQYLLRLDLSRSFVGMFAVASWALLCLFRLNAGRLMGAFRREFGKPIHVMVVGTGEAALRIGSQIEDAESYGVRLKGFFTEEGRQEVLQGNLQGTYPVHPLAELPELLRKDVIDEMIFAVDSRRLAELEDMFLLCEEEGVRTRVAVDFFPHVNSQVYLDRLGVSPLLTFSATPHDEIRLLVKRATDVVVSAIALLILSPFIAIIAILVKLTSPGPAIFRQMRCGLNGRQFEFYKFRSMCDNAEAMRAELEHLNEKGSVVFKMKNDPRLTPLGRWLRKFSIDEWPQLWNVLKGDMSLVGPRPPLPEEVKQYERWQRRRLRMRPGLTCLWVVKGRDKVDFEDWMKMDMQYIDNWSLALDWQIILRTIPQVLIGRGAH
jgi:exopolysaccharide biosynthesis polyprenyl glycosylphosphotransferase